MKPFQLRSCIPSVNLEPHFTSELHIYSIKSPKHGKAQKEHPFRLLIITVLKARGQAGGGKAGKRNAEWAALRNFIKTIKEKYGQKGQDKLIGWEARK